MVRRIGCYESAWADAPIWMSKTRLTLSATGAALAAMAEGGSMYFVRIGGTGGRSASGFERRKTSVFCTLWIAGENESSVVKKSVGLLQMR